MKYSYCSLRRCWHCSNRQAHNKKFFFCGIWIRPTRSTQKADSFIRMSQYSCKVGNSIGARSQNAHIKVQFATDCEWAQLIIRENTFALGFPAGMNGNSLYAVRFVEIRNDLGERWDNSAKTTLPSRTWAQRSILIWLSHVHGKRGTSYSKQQWSQRAADVCAWPTKELQSNSNGAISFGPTRNPTFLFG